VLNATAAIAVSKELGLDAASIATGLAAFQGVDRRFQIKGEAAGVTVIDDYGHHPTEVRATLNAARQRQFSKIHVLFQPHRFTRTQILMDDFARSFFDADSVTLLDIYAASEPPIEGVNSGVLIDKMRASGQRDVQYAPGLDAAAAMLAQKAQPGDMVLTLGAGTVSQAGELILAELRK
jgi:UDP-N-acetylmuramate--alanine ligase